MKKTIIYQLLLLLSFTVTGQDVALQVEYPSVVEAGQQFNVSWTVNAGGGEFSAPAFPGFNKLVGPQTSYSQSISNINGKTSQQISYTYTYFLQSQNAGKYTLNPAIFKLKNKTYYSDSIHIEVVGSGAQNQNATSEAGNAAGQSDSENTGGDVFVTLSLSRKEVYIGEPIVATVKLFTRVNLSGINEIKFPAFDNFLKSDIATPPLTSLKQESVRGVIYGTGVVQQFLLYPQITGEISIEPVQISVLVQQRSGQRDPFFGDFFAQYQSVPKAIASMPVKVKVKALPGTKPDDFSGVVGKIEFKAGINKDTVNVNDAINLRISVSGTGNLKIAGAPLLKLSPDIEIYDPKISEDIKNTINGTSGQKNFEYLLIPRHYGDFTIPPVTYSYFNVATGRYEKLTTREFRFHARKGNEQNSGITVYGGISKEDVKYVGKDIRFIKSDSGSFTRSSDRLILKRSFYSLYAFAAFLFLIVLFVRREHVKRNSDLSMVRNRKAGKIAVKRLRSASACLKNEELDRFYEEILKSIWGYLSDKLNIPVSDLTRNNAIISLIDRGIDEETIKSLTDILEKCEFARYSPAASGSEAATIYDGAARFIKTVENTIG